MNTAVDETRAQESHDGVWFVYDGECPVCSMAAQALRIKKSVGALHLVDAREDTEHPLLKEVHDRRLNLDDGMVLKFRDRYYHGDDALHMMALLGSGQGWFNRMNALLFKSRTLARVCYPVMRGARNTLLRLIGRQKIRNLTIDRHEPLFKPVFGEQWNALPTVMKHHYAVRPFSSDFVKAEGHLDVTISPLMSLMAKFTGMLLAYPGKNVPVTVVFRSDKTGAFVFDRTFHFSDKGDVTFRSRMEWIKGNELVEFMRYGIGWKIAFEWDGSKAILRHSGYIWRIFGVMIPVPLALFIGKGHAEEVPLSEDTFSLWAHVKHPMLGETFGYAGDFRITAASCNTF